MKEIQLFDSEQGKTHTFMVSDENYEEITTNNNLTLAAVLLEKEQEEDNFKAAFNVMQSNRQTSKSSQAHSTVTAVSGNDDSNSETLVTSVNTETDATYPSNSENSKIWSDGATKLLIELCQKYENEFENGIKKYVWNKVARGITETFKQSYSAQQCDTKWKVLKNMYKQIKKHNEQTGNNRKKWKYFSLMDEILYCRPEINPTVTCSNNLGLITATPTRDGQVDNGLAGTLNDSENNSSSNNQNTPSFHSSFMKKRKVTENAAERRHREKMARQDRYLDLLDRLTTAVEKNTGNQKITEISCYVSADFSKGLFLDLC
ncbi:hypothetical protein JTB14_002502 [Gonioctena quinquepunctata]|nr:hypothetical protein JTB14_002502 [Gonioctena quinquepunctata]